MGFSCSYRCRSSTGSHLLAGVALRSPAYLWQRPGTYCRVMQMAGRLGLGSQWIIGWRVRVVQGFFRRKASYGGHIYLRAATRITTDTLAPGNLLSYGP